jgi:hypothetical protein
MAPIRVIFFNDFVFISGDFETNAKAWILFHWVEELFVSLSVMLV